MANLLQIKTSIFQQDGQSSQLVEEIKEKWLSAHPNGTVTTRDLAVDPVPHLTLPRFQAFSTKWSERTVDEQAVVDYSDTLIDEIRNADVLVLGVPMYNFSVPSSLHSYFDHVARVGETFQYTPEGPVGLLTGKKAYVVITRGGFYGENHGQTSFIRQFLGFIGISDVEFIHAEGLAVNDEAKTDSLLAARNSIAQIA
ncbi:FMN-dependent NADH-azoreductase [uncultured Microbulbifer sp.]|uniref:FMN-dependent NADH-azoreductase n=1 Tax=uncultured Microbulbifer sp. TaxID=348147 RepID=UPI0025E03C28|nr:FMN-dependent NADH-azoreductase [uncultured Microbulbifer sp.]